MNLKKTLTIMEKAATEAGSSLLKMKPKVRRLSARKDFLTNADIVSEKIIFGILQTKYPEIPFLSEESGGEYLKNGYLWVIDPIDGTINYFLGDDHWGISIALLKNGQAITGVIYLPAKGLVFSAILGCPAKFRHNKETFRKKLSVSKENDLKNSQFWVGWGKEEHGGNDHHKICGLLEKLTRHTLYPQIRNSCTADAMMVASGKIAGYIFPKPEPFDIAAAGSIVECAGGIVTDINGKPWSPFGSFVASNKSVHKKLLNLLSPKLKGGV
jgi:myo-inositol-1(or 4)-monophosphatase